jgi:hypothetical protein
MRYNSSMTDELITVLERLEVPTEVMPPQVAEYVLGIRISEAEQERYQSLAERHNNGELSRDELKELDAFVDTNALLMIVQAIARKAIDAHQPAA